MRSPVKVLGTADRGVADVHLDELDGGRDGFESVPPSIEEGGEVWAFGISLLV